jgi:hypothetical protein
MSYGEHYLDNPTWTLEKLEPHLIFVYALFWKVANFLFTLSTKEDHQNRRSYFEV